MSKTVLEHCVSQNAFSSIAGSNAYITFGIHSLDLQQESVIDVFPDYDFISHATSE